ncbi:MAG: long-chain-acyl-CoA synthetase [Alphaproteobacteria bacterium]|nr:long-chain-acyl-CoA synthetase [Alphaproteobacteria bacterium]
MGVGGAIQREAIYIAAIARTLALTRPVRPDATITVADWIERWAKDRPASPAILHQDRIVTYSELDRGANRYARWAASQGLRKGDVVTLLMENCPEYLMAWIGLTKQGCIAALVNTHLAGQPLSHSINLAGAKHLILGGGLAEKYATAARALETQPTLWMTGGPALGAEDLDAALAVQSDAWMGHETRADLKCRDKALYIYTSGTTGLPKAANISHMRLLYIMSAFQGAVNAGRDDRMYDVLPLYHSAGGICALGPVFLGGGSLIIRDKFSATEFWDDCRRYKPTVFQYIGELCRYLLNTPPHSHERDHSLRIAIGNGLRPEIWPRFQERFRIPRIMEFYGATEGNVGMINYDGHVGAIGRVPRYISSILKIRLVRYDVEHQMPVRGPDGCCIETADNEVGEAIGRIDPNDPRGRFDGYTKKEDTEKKILRDVFKKVDAWFRTGDLMRRDAHGYFYFVDRTGDTFRWKGENVATSEVAETLSVFPGIKEANVYGVEVPGDEGKAGMASLVAEKSLDLGALARYLERNLPSYARPVFLRFSPEIEVTSTFKQRKVELQKEGYDPANIADPLFVREAASGRYVKLDAVAHEAIARGAMKL